QGTDGRRSISSATCGARSPIPHAVRRARGATAGSASPPASGKRGPAEPVSRIASRPVAFEQPGVVRPIRLRARLGAAADQLVAGAGRHVDPGVLLAVPARGAGAG